MSRTVPAHLQCPMPPPDAVQPEAWWQDAYERLRAIPEGSVQLVYFDPPYGVTKAGWDVPLDMPDLLPEILRVLKPDGAIVVHSQGMFTAETMVHWKHVPRRDGTGPTRKKLWRYNLIWDKRTVRGFLNANRMPLRAHEDIMVFWPGKLPPFNPQFTWGHKPLNDRGKRKRTKRTDQAYGHFENTPVDPETATRRHPTSIVRIPAVKFPVFGVQKPVALAEWIIKTYTNPGDVVCDPTMGSGTALIAGARCGRYVIGGDSAWEQVALTNLRMNLELGLAPALPQGLEFDDLATLARLDNPDQYRKALLSGAAA